MSPGQRSFRTSRAPTPPVVAVTPAALLVGGLASSSSVDPQAEFMDLALLLTLPVVGLLAAAPWFAREAWRGWSRG